MPFRFFKVLHCETDMIDLFYFHPFGSLFFFSSMAFSILSGVMGYSVEIDTHRIGDCRRSRPAPHIMATDMPASFAP